jgi:glc operon protein GlcG
MQIREYGSPISLRLAKEVAAAAEVAAIENGWSMVIAIVDSTGHLVVLHKMDHAQFGSVEIAQSKACTAVNFKRPTKIFEEAVAAGGLGLRLLSTPGLCALEGGVPLVSDGRLIGAIGVSGAQAAQDGIVALAGARAISE